MKKGILSLSLAAGLLTCAPKLSAQQQTNEEVDMYSLSLEELMNIPIVSASKKSETLFEAPLSSYTITRADIEKAGSTSIMEALRLAPGVIVREQTNGTYDIHIRGFDNILRYSRDFTKANLTTLVMIDNRPVFNHNLGGTFWEALPVDLNDVERIEIVRGPSAPLFGPNAVTGVINIITRRASSKAYTNANVQFGSPSTTIVNASGGSKLSDKFAFTISGNYQKRERFEDTYFNPATESYLPADQVFANAAARYSDPSLALEKYGINAFMNITPNDKTSVDISVGTQDAEVQKNFLGTTVGSPFTTGTTKSNYANLSSKLYGFNVRASVVSGKENLNVGAPPNSYDYTIADAVVEHEFSLGKKYTITPGISYQSVSYNDEDYAADGPTFLNGTKELNNAAAFVRTDLNPVKNLRIIAALRADKFSAPDDVYFAYELATTYSVNENHLVRAAITRSNSGSFIATTKLDLYVPTPLPGVTIHRYGNENLDLFTVDMIELGYRSQVSKSIQLDLDVFAQKANHFNALLVKQSVPTGPTTSLAVDLQAENVPTTSTQVGATLALNFVPSERIQFKPFVTVQKTETKDLPSSFDDPNVKTVTYSNSKHLHTPAAYGGFYFNYKATEKLNFNLNGYYFTSHRQYNSTDLDNNSEAGDISGVLLLNAKVSYQVIKGLNLFLNGRNILNSDSREYWGTDKIGSLFAAGATFNLD